ncbi:uncharacterized protein ccdc141 isoform X2 [Dunckerocampus dactyliophorus]|uniref:uncharacterized protein ccdc141 isoform X2 n=1 Tax=Dunckerocampus dactyliophorus TaxID=161453 RepID=UPI002406F488|nr:uncharacterized protein ccdc141 isoform X2 [Dunckerocampus dactyliophorus]
MWHQSRQEASCKGRVMTSGEGLEVATRRGHEDAGVTRTDNGKSFTTLSTIAVQAGQSQLVVSVLKSGSLVHLQLVRVHPDLCEIGTNQEDNRTLMQEHEELLKTMTKRQQEVVEAAGKIRRKRKRQEEDQRVYKAMEACLNEGWRHLLRLLERRQEVLRLAANFYQAASQLSLGVDNFEDALMQADMRSADVTLTLDSMRKDVLRRSLKVLLSGGQLLSELKLLQHTDGLCGAPTNSRLNQQVALRLEVLVETLQDRRRMVEQVLRRQLDPAGHDVTVGPDLRHDFEFKVEQRRMQRSLCPPKCGISPETKPDSRPDPNPESRSNMSQQSQSELKFMPESRTNHGCISDLKPEIKSNLELKSVLKIESFDPNPKSRSGQKPASTLDETRNMLSGCPDLSRSVVTLTYKPDEIGDLEQGPESKGDGGVFKQENFTSISGVMPDLQKCSGNRMEQNNTHSDTHRELLTNQNQQLLLTCQQLLDKVSQWVEQSRLLLSKCREVEPQLSEAEDLLDTHLLLRTWAETAGHDANNVMQLLQRLQVPCMGPPSKTQLEVPGGRVSHLSRLKSLTVQLKQRGRTGPAAEVQLSARVSAVLDEVKSLNNIVECNMRVLRGFVSFIRTAQQLEKDIKNHRRALEGEKEEEDVSMTKGTSWWETMQKVITAQEEASKFISSIATASVSGLNLQSMATAVQQMAERLGRSQQEVSDLRRKLEIENRKRGEDRKLCSKYQERLRKAARDLKEVSKLLDSCTQVDLGSHGQTSRLQQQFRLAGPHFARLDDQVQILLKDWDALTPAQNHLLLKEELKEEEVSELRVLCVKVKEKIHQSHHILDLSINFHLLAKQLEAFLQSDAAGPLCGTPSAYEETRHQIHQLLKKAFWVKKEIGKMISDNAPTKFRMEQLEHSVASLYTQSMPWLIEASLRDHALMRDLQQVKSKAEFSKFFGNQKVEDDRMIEQKWNAEQIQVDSSHLTVKGEETGHTPEVTTQHDGKEALAPWLTDANLKHSSLKTDNSQSRQRSQCEENPGASSYCSTHTFRLSCSPVEVGRRVYVIYGQLDSTSLQAMHTSQSASVQKEPAGGLLEEELQQQDVVAEVFLSSDDEYECASSDDISLPPLAETPESILFQDDVEEHFCFSSTSIHNSQSINKYEYKNQPEIPGTGLATVAAKQHKESSQAESFVTAPSSLHSDTRQPISTQTGKTLTASIPPTKSTYKSKDVLERRSSSQSHGCSQCKLEQRNPSSKAQLIQISFLKTGTSNQTATCCPLPSQSPDFDLNKSRGPQQCTGMHKFHMIIPQTTTTFPQDIRGPQSLLDTFQAEKKITPFKLPDTRSKWSTVKSTIYNFQSSTRSSFTSCQGGTMPHIGPDPQNLFRDDTIFDLDQETPCKQSSKEEDVTVTNKTLNCPSTPSSSDQDNQVMPPQEKDHFKHGSMATSPQISTSFFQDSPESKLDFRIGLDQDLSSLQIREEPLSVFGSQISLHNMTTEVQPQIFCGHSIATHSECERSLYHDGPEVFATTWPPESQCSGCNSSKQSVHGHGMTPSNTSLLPVTALPTVLAKKASLHVTTPFPPSHELTPKEDQDFCQPVAIREEIKFTPQFQGLPLPVAPHPQTQKRLFPHQQAFESGLAPFTMPLSKAAVMGGVPVNLEVAVTEHPEPKVTWFKDCQHWEGDLKKDHGEVQGRWLLAEVVDIISDEMTTCFGTCCLLLWLLLLLTGL